MKSVMPLPPLHEAAASSWLHDAARHATAGWIDTVFVAHLARRNLRREWFAEAEQIIVERSCGAAT